MNDRRINGMLTVILFAMMIVLVGTGCTGEADDATETGTIAPATPEPNVDVDNDPALTRTVDPGEDRSPYEGGPLADDEVIGGEPAPSDTTATTTAEAPPDPDDSTP